MITCNSNVIFYVFLMFFTSRLVFANRWVYNEQLGHSYYVKNGLPGLNFTEAEEHCVSIGGHLASIHSKEENLLLKNLAKPYNIYDRATSRGLLFGLHRNEFNASLWQYTDRTQDSSVDYMNWRAHEPNNVNSTEHCTIILASENGLAMKFYEEWNDFLCDYKYPMHICKQSFTANANENVTKTSNVFSSEVTSDRVTLLLVHFKAGLFAIINVVFVAFLFRCLFLLKCSRNNYKIFRDFLPRFDNSELTEDNSIYAEIPNDPSCDLPNYIQLKQTQLDSQCKKLVNILYMSESTDV